MTQCVVCLSPNDGDSTPLLCGHALHKECATRWFTTQKSCPHCRKPAFGKSQKPCKLSDRLEAFVDSRSTWKPGDFWPSWLVAELKDVEDFSLQEKAYVKDLAYQSFDRVGFFKVLKMLESSSHGVVLGSSPPTRSYAFTKMYL